MSEVSAETIEHWRAWIGRSESFSQYLDAATLLRFAAAIGGSPDVQHDWPALGHWAYFQRVVAPGELGRDGHPKRGGFYPPIELPRRMFAAAQIEMHRPLALGATATLTSTILEIRHRQGRQGELVIVDVERLIEQFDSRCIREVQSIVYRAGEGLGALPVVTMPEDSVDVLWQPGPVDLFRFSAVTGNAHRIHYDQRYATEEEGYPALVVQGPLTAVRLFAYAQARHRRGILRFSFRALAPLFVSQPVRLVPGAGEGEICALRCDGMPAMQAKADFLP